MRSPYDMSNLAQMPQQEQQVNMPQIPNGIDPLVVAGYSIIKGTPIGEAMMQAAQLQQGQHQQRLAQFDAEQRRRKEVQAELMMQNLPEALKGLDVSNPNAAIAMLVQQGLDPAQASSIVSNLANQQLQRQQLAQQSAGGNGMSALEQKLLFEKYKMDNSRDERKLIKQEKAIEENEIQAEKANDLLSQVNELESLLPQFRTGFGSDVAQVFNRVVGDSGKAAAHERFNSLSGKLVLDAAKELKGTISDKDLDFLEKQTPSANLTQAGNIQIINGLKEAANRKIQYTEAANDYVSRGGDLKDFNKSWRKQVEANSIFSKKNEPSAAQSKEERFAELNAKFGGR